MCERTMIKKKKKIMIDSFTVYIVNYTLIYTLFLSHFFTLNCSSIYTFSHGLLKSKIDSLNRKLQNSLLFVLLPLNLTEFSIKILILSYLTSKQEQDNKGALKQSYNFGRLIIHFDSSWRQSVKLCIIYDKKRVISREKYYCLKIIWEIIYLMCSTLCSLNYGISCIWFLFYFKLRYFIRKVNHIHIKLGSVKR